MNTTYLKNTYKEAASKARTLRNKMRIAKQGSRSARAEGNIPLADSGMWDAIDLWEAGNHDRDYRRHLHLAYGYAKGRTYKECEQKCREGNEPSPSFIANLTSEDGIAHKAVHKAVKLWVEAGDIRRDPEAEVEADPEAAAEGTPAPNKGNGLLARLRQSVGL